MSLITKVGQSFSLAVKVLDVCAASWFVFSEKNVKNAKHTASVHAISRGRFIGLFSVDIGAASGAKVGCDHIRT